MWFCQGCFEIVAKEVGWPGNRESPGILTYYVRVKYTHPENWAQLERILSLGKIYNRQKAKTIY